MCPRLQRGFGVIAAIVILVIMALLATFILVVSNAQQHDAALDITGARAYAAAMSGSEWGVSQALAGNCAFGSRNLGPINGMAVTVTAAEVAAGDAVEAGLVSICRIVSTACNLPVAGACPGENASPTYVERQIIALPER